MMDSIDDKIDTVMTALWGDNPEALVSSMSLKRFGVFAARNLINKLEMLDPNAAERISPRIERALLEYVSAKPYDLRKACEFSRNFVRYALDPTLTIFYLNWAEAEIEEAMDKLSRTHSVDDKKGFKWGNTSEIYA